MKKYFTSILLLFSVVITSQAQNIDSLRNLTNTGNATQKINANIELSDYFFYSTPDTAEYYLNKALEIAQKEKLQKNKALLN